MSHSQHARRRTAVLLALTFALGAGAGWAAKKKTVDAALYQGKDQTAAARALAELAMAEAGEGTWERIAVGRVYYLGGMKAEGQKIFDDVLASKKVKAGDWIRVGRVYYDAGEWDKAKAAFDKVLELEPDDAPWLAEIGAYHNLKRDRARAEELFARSFAIEPDAVYSTVHVAGSYVGVLPR